MSRPLSRLLLGAAAITVSAVPLANAANGLITRQFTRAGVPLVYRVTDRTVLLERHLAAHRDVDVDHEAELAGQVVPGIIVAHGFSASRRLMDGYALRLAHAGYAVISVDFAGHGANAHGFVVERLQDEIDRAYAVLVDQPEVDPARIGLLGHSMGSGAVMESARRRPERYRATVAVSPVPFEATPLTPRNLQLHAGAWEPRFVDQARRTLASAGGPGDDFSTGRARDIVEIPRAEHVTIVFREASQGAAVDWFDRALDHRPEAPRQYRDRRVLWMLLNVAGWLAILSSLAPAHRPDAPPLHPGGQPRWYLPLLLVAPLLTAVACVGIAHVLDLSRLGGMLVGGGVAFWLLIAGANVLGFAAVVGRPTSHDVLWGGVLFGFLWVALGLTSNGVWLTWTLVGPRLLRWPLLALACIPWFVAAELAQGDVRRPGRAATSTLIAGALMLGLWGLARLVPGMGILTLLLPVVPAFLLVFAIAGARVNRPWAYGIGCGSFFGWLLASAFPIVG